MGHHRWLHNQFPQFFSVLNCPLGIGGLQASPVLDVVYPLLFSVCLVFFPISLCLARWFWPDVMKGRHVHTTQLLLLLLLSLYNGQEVFTCSNCLLDLVIVYKPFSFSRAGGEVSCFQIHVVTQHVTMRQCILVTGSCSLSINVAVVESLSLRAFVRSFPTVSA